MTYKDKTFCVSPGCKNKCHRKMTDEESKEVNMYDIPVSMSGFCDKDGELLCDKN